MVIQRLLMLCFTHLSVETSITFTGSTKQRSTTLWMEGEQNYPPQDFYGNQGLLGQTFNYHQLKEHGDPDLDHVAGRRALHRLPSCCGDVSL